MKERIFYEEFESLYYYHGTTQNWLMQGFHFHRQYEIILFKCDGATIQVGNRSYEVKYGDLFILNNKEYHRTCRVLDGDYHRYVLMFEPEILIPMNEQLGYDFTRFFENRPENFIHRLSLNTENLKIIESQLKKIEENINSKDTQLGRVKITLLILELIISINEMYDFFMEKLEHKDDVFDDSVTEFQDPIMYRERIEQIKKYIACHVTEKLELDDIANRFYLSRYYLSHYFKKETGFTLSQYIASQKIMTAKAMLKRGSSVTDVALALSYNSDSHFISVFKKVTGTTPKQYAKEKLIDNNKV